MKTNIWQTTNQEPWVESVLSGRTKVKTRRSKPVVPVGAIVFLHASKSMWPGWREIIWTNEIDKEDLHLGFIVGIAVVSAVGRSRDIFLQNEWKAFDMKYGGNCAAEWCVRFNHVSRLDIPVPTRGFQSPFCRAKLETVEAVLDENPFVEDLFELSMV